VLSRNPPAKERPVDNPPFLGINIIPLLLLLPPKKFPLKDSGNREIIAGNGT